MNCDRFLGALIGNHLGNLKTGKTRVTPGRATFKIRVPRCHKSKLPRPISIFFRVSIRWDCVLFKFLFFMGVCLVRYLRIPRKIWWQRKFRKYHIYQLKFQKNQNFLPKFRSFDTKLWFSFGPSGIEHRNITNGLISCDVFYRISPFSVSGEQSWIE